MIEPYRIKVVEPLCHVSRRERERALANAAYNPFQISADRVSIDLISDSGTGAMSTQQWAAMIRAREDFSGQSANREFVDAAQQVFGLPYVQPVHQGRVAENILFKLLLKPGQTVIANTHFLTTRENIAAVGCRAVDMPACRPPFYGDIDLEKLDGRLRADKQVGLVILTMTSNIHGGQPVSMDNMRAARRLTRKSRIPLLFDASRFAGNTYIIKERTKSTGSLRSVCRQQFCLCDTAYMSCKKDGLVNIGGCIMTRSKGLFREISHEIIRQESFPHAGGLAARDLAAMSTGLKEAFDQPLLRSHIESVRYLADRLMQKQVRVFEPVGAHAVSVQPRSNDRFAAFALAAAVFLDSGIRGGVFDNQYRLAIPRRVYTHNHLDHVADMVGRAFHREPMRLKCIYRPRKFFNFFVRFTVRSGRTT
jgi:tryptophanase